MYRLCKQKKTHLLTYLHTYYFVFPNFLMVCTMYISKYNKKSTLKNLSLQSSGWNSSVNGDSWFLIYVSEEKQSWIFKKKMKFKNVLLDSKSLVWLVLARAIYTRRVMRKYGIFLAEVRTIQAMVHGKLQIFVRNKTFLFVQIKSWNF